MLWDPNWTLTLCVTRVSSQASEPLERGPAWGRGTAARYQSGPKAALERNSLTDPSLGATLPLRILHSSPNTHLQGSEVKPSTKASRTKASTKASRSLGCSLQSSESFSIQWIRPGWGSSS